MVQVQIHPSAKKLILGFCHPVFCLLMGVAAIHIHFHEKPNWALLICGLLFVVAGVPLLLVELYRASVWGAHVVINEAGIWDRRGRIGLIAWESVDHMELDAFARQVRVYARQIDGARRITKVLSKIEGGLDWDGDPTREALCIDCSMLKKDASELWLELKRFARDGAFETEGSLSYWKKYWQKR